MSRRAEPWCEALADYPADAQGKAPATSPNYREEAERIVEEERVQGEKVPKYEVSDVSSPGLLLIQSQGLEEYTLIEKMGDGAFSNVYKAVVNKTGQKCAVKVVRKYELNSSQVRRALSFFLVAAKTVTCALATHGIMAIEVFPVHFFLASYSPPRTSTDSR